MSRRTLKVIAISYALKTLLIGVAWLYVPDLPQRTRASVLSMWSRLWD